MADNSEITNNPSGRTIAKVVQRGGRPAIDKTILVRTNKNEKIVITPEEITLSRNKIVSQKRIPGGQVRTLSKYTIALPDPAFFLGGSD